MPLPAVQGRRADVVEGYDLAVRPVMLWLDKRDHPRGAWTDQDPSGGWPFGTTLPYHPGVDAVGDLPPLSF